ncbi:hypothetical protein [Salmonella bongori]|uniref:hypothetical protein n=1 Tax=Salmonella bongori TaxID=54736 RepID=UPI0015C56921|nr:hypothetical protein [Salmonella bongori]
MTFESFSELPVCQSTRSERAVEARFILHQVPQQANHSTLLPIKKAACAAFPIANRVEIRLYAGDGFALPGHE